MGLTVKRLEVLHTWVEFALGEPAPIKGFAKVWHMLLLRLRPPATRWRRAFGFVDGVEDLSPDAVTVIDTAAHVRGRR